MQVLRSEDAGEAIPRRNETGLVPPIGVISHPGVPLNWGTQAAAQSQLQKERCELTLGNKRNGVSEKGMTKLVSVCFSNRLIQQQAKQGPERVKKDS